MSVSIRGCPTCAAMVIGDSPSCPHCGHVFDAHRAKSEFLDLIPSGELSVSDAEDEMPCKQCGEMVRTGLVRCWHCGAFTNSEIEATYQRMQATPSPVMYSDVSPTADHVPETNRSFGVPAKDEGGFDLSAGYRAQSGDEDDFTIAPDVRSVPTAVPASNSDYQIAALGEDDFTISGGVTAQPQEYQTADAGQATYDQGAYEQQAYDQYQTPWGYKLSADGTAWEIDIEVWHQAGYDPYAQPGEPGYYDPNAAQQSASPAESAEGYAVAPISSDNVPIPDLPPDPAVGVSATELPPPPDVAHSVSTGGEALLAAAMEEEKDSAKTRRPGFRKLTNPDEAPPGTFRIFCPNGHKVLVHERHRGRAGRCPSCKAVFFVPALEAAAQPADGAAAAAPTGPQTYAVGNYTDWLFDIRLHTINPQKLKLKPGAMAAEYDIADIAFSNEDMLVAMIFKRAGAFAAMQEKKKKPATRLAVGDFLQTKKPVSGLPVPFQTLVTNSDANLLKIVQPAIPGEESIFAGIPVFGDGRIVVRLPVTLEAGTRCYLSFSLSEFREFARLLEKVFGIVNFGQELGIPLTDTISTYKCHYSENELNTLERPEYYQFDPALKPIVLGRKCAGCGLIVSEDARKKEKIGGKNEASIAKATCPKCKKKFGDITLYGLDPNAKPIVWGMLPVEK